MCNVWPAAVHVCGCAIVVVKSLPKPRPRRRWLKHWRSWSFIYPLRRDIITSPPRWTPSSTLCDVSNKWKVKWFFLFFCPVCSRRPPLTRFIPMFWCLCAHTRLSSFVKAKMFLLPISFKKSQCLTANEEYYQLLMINDSQPSGLDVSSYTIEEIDSITSEYTLKNNVRH